MSRDCYKFAHRSLSFGLPGREGLYWILSDEPMCIVLFPTRHRGIDSSLERSPSITRKAYDANISPKSAMIINGRRTRGGRTNDRVLVQPGQHR